MSSAHPAAEAMARRQRLLSWVGVLYLFLGLGNMTFAVMGGVGNPEWLRWLLAVGFLALAVWWLDTGCGARRMLRSLDRS